MNTRSLIGVVCLGITLAGRAQIGSLVQTTNAPPPQDTPYTIISRDTSSRIWERATYDLGPDGQWVTNLHSYTELASGICYQPGGRNGQWLDSVEEIDPAPTGGAQALQAPHQAYFPYNLYSGVIQVVTPDGITLQSRPVGISFFDGTNSVLVSTLTNSIGQIISPNQIIYTNAFTDISADLLVEYRKSGLECDLVFRSQIPAPESFGLSSPVTRLELLTEFFNTPDPVQTQATSIGGVDNVTLGFGQMKMVRGKAFEIGTPNPGAPSMGIPVGKSWGHINGRTFLIEEVSYPLISPQLNTLPSLASAAAPVAQPARRVVLSRRSAAKAEASREDGSRLRVQAASRLRSLALPPSRSSKPATNTMKLAQADFARKSGVVLDYPLLNGDTTNFTFQSDTTYLISGILNGYGITTFEGGTVIKYVTTNAASSIQLWGNVDFATTNYRPAIFTSCNDDSVGVSTDISNAPTYYDSVLSIDAGGEDVLMQNVRICYTLWGLHPYGENFTLNNSQFVNCSNAFYPEYVHATINNILMSSVSNAFGGVNYTINGCQMTINCGELTTTWGSPSASSVFLTNSLLINVTNNGSVSVNTGFTVATNNGIFQSVGAGNYYLADDSPYRNAGTTNIDAALLAALQQKTTYPPILYSNVVFSNNITLGPQAQRDYDIPDLGYHYDPVDYLVDQAYVTNATLYVTNGAVLAGYNDSDLLIDDGSSIVSFGSPLAPNWLTRYSCVQEQPLALGNLTPGSAAMVNPWHATNEPAGLFRFTKFSCPAGGGSHLFHANLNFAYSNLLVQDCEFWSGTNDFTGYNNTFAILKNNLFARSGINARSFSYTNDNLAVSNNLFWNMTFTVRPGQNSNTCFFFNNDFDNCTISTNSSSLTVNGYNAYLVNINRLSPTNAFDIVSTNDIAYETGPLGAFYQPTSSILIGQGSCTAGDAALFHYTVLTNEVPESNSVVTIGYHYVALGTNGLPLDSNGNGIPDYLEDVNGTGQGLTVTLISPTNNASFTEPATIPLQATVMDWQSIATNVVLLHDGIQITAVPTSPYTYSWPLVAAGTYSLTATAHDVAGSVTNSPAVNVAVTNLCSN